MTVAELIEKLKTLPQGHLVVYRSCSDMNVMEPDDVKVVRGVKHHNLEDTVRDYNEHEWGADKTAKVCPKCKQWSSYLMGRCAKCRCPTEQVPMVPEFVDVVQFPGN